MATSAYTIVRNAPPPPEGVTTGRKARYPFAQLEVGDAFDVACDIPPNDKFRYPDYNRVTAACSFYNSSRSPAPGRVFRARLLDDDSGGKFVRVWRLS